LQTAAELSGVSYNTARNWKRQAAEDGDDWDVARNAKRLSRGSVEELTGQILQDLVEQFTVTIEAMKKADNMSAQQRAEILVQLSDSYVKSISAAGKANPKLNRLSVAMEVVKELAAYIAERHPKHRQLFIDILEDYGPNMAQHFGN
jgi:CRISPR/Cas system CMR subunit Cmr4 (Cas7 group RAMP superfamily)